MFLQEILETQDPLLELFNDLPKMKQKVPVTITVVKEIIVITDQIISTVIIDLLPDHIILREVVPHPREGVLVPLEVLEEVVQIKRNLKF